jgi:cobalt/nickel transport system permease protein
MLTVLLGPYAAFLVIASVLTVQAFFFADGGLLALGCNIFNLGFFPAFVAHPLIYRFVARDQHGASRAWVAAIVAAVVGLQLGAFSVVLETKASGISALPFGTFMLMMLPIHLAIGVVEGLATAAVVAFIARARPEALPAASAPGTAVRLRPVLLGLAAATVAVGGVASWFASAHPDGLEWSVTKVSGREELQAPAAGMHQSLAGLQEKTAFLPGYGFKTAEQENTAAEPAKTAPEPWPAVSAGTTVSGIVGGLLTLALACLIGAGLKACASRRVSAAGG